MPEKPKKKTAKQIRAAKKHEHEVNKSSHHERVQMRQMLRDSGVIDKNADNETADRWLYRHGYLYAANYKPPQDRVAKLRRNLGL